MIVRIEEDPAALADDWNALLDDSAQSSFNVRPLWMLTWWRHFAPRGARPYVITCRDDSGRLVGLAPLYFDPSDREIRFIGVSTDHDTPANLSAAILARRGSEATVVNAVADTLASDGDWTRLWLARIRPELETSRLIVAAMRGTATTNTERNVCVPIRGDWETYRQSLGRAGRKRVQRYARRAVERGFVFRRVASCGELERATAQYLDWHSARFESEGVYARSQAAAFLREVAARGFGEGRVRVWIAELGGAIAAVDMAFVDRGAITAFQGHADPEHAALRLGHVMTAHFLRDSFDDPLIENVHLGRAAAHKHTWSDETWGTVDFVSSRATA
jgi:CelD/BcsL family acetyltransferase involved in cellulose biosynthesis